jgi:aprataxin
MFLTALRTYATTPDPSTIKPSIRLLHTDKTITIFDLYPKSTFHFLLLPRLIPPLTSKNSSNLKSLLQWNKEKALEYILLMKSEAEAVKTMIEDEMVRFDGEALLLFKLAI